MRPRLAIAVLVCLWMAWPAAAQSDCGNGLPCGPVPWSLPVLPALISPTPFPVQEATAIATATGTITPTPSPTTDLSMDALNDQLNTLQAVVGGTQVAATTSEPGSFSPDNIGETIPIFFRFTHWIQDFRYGVFTPLMQILVFAFFSALVFGLLNLFVPLFAPLIGLMRWAFDLLSKLAQLIGQIIQIIVQFIRG